MKLDGFKLKREITEMKKRSCVHIIRCLFLLVVVSCLIGWSPMTATQAIPVFKAEEDSMGLAQKTESPAIPPIDAAAPSNFETASFGLG
jgi:hypothetical protein